MRCPGVSISPAWRSREMQSCCVPSSAAAPHPTSQNAPKAVQPVTTAGRIIAGCGLPQKMIHCQLLRLPPREHNFALRRNLRHTRADRPPHAAQNRDLRVRPSATPSAASSRGMRPSAQPRSRIRSCVSSQRTARAVRIVPPPSPAPAPRAYIPADSGASIPANSPSSNSPCINCTNLCRRARFGAARE